MKIPWNSSSSDHKLNCPGRQPHTFIYVLSVAVFMLATMGESRRWNIKQLWHLWPINLIYLLPDCSGLIGGPPEDMSLPCYLNPMMLPYLERVFADEMKGLEITPSWIIGDGSQIQGQVFMKERRGEDSEAKVIWQRSHRLKLCSYKPRNP